KGLAKVFFWIGLFFALFAALLMANFISTSIHYKRQEIGILRAIGSRSADVFRIFFSESFLIAVINFTLSAFFCAAAVILINYVVRDHYRILITVLHFGIRQIILLILVSLAVAALASFLPVRRIAKKRPIDAIRDK
ncbi:MAG: FtsX-like permease family protein, partial [Oscillospiraceae bacterium]|nr:FtsX-like permease family protein [Oscillospiraceae bacterium]